MSSPAPCQHIAFVMDGNGRWATQQQLPRTDGHEAGAKVLFDILEALQEMGVKWVTVFSFSTENWNRPESEIKYLFDFNYRMILERKKELIDRGVRVYFSGSHDKRIPWRLRRQIDKIVKETEQNTEANLIVAFNYGGRAEIVNAVKELLKLGIKPEELTEDRIRSHLYVPEAPYPDLVVRTSGESRISNFLLWQIAYSELIFCDVLWPDFGIAHLKEVLDEYKRRERRYGGLAGE